MLATKTAHTLPFMLVCHLSAVVPQGAARQIRLHTRNTRTNPQTRSSSPLSPAFSLSCCFLPVLAEKTSLHSPHVASFLRVYT